MIWLNKAYFPAEIHSQPAVSYTRRCWKLLFPPPTRRAVLRRRRQRDLSLWTPILRLRARRKNRAANLFCAWI